MAEKSSKSDRESRLAEALRANLRRRKAPNSKANGDQTRENSADDAPSTQK